MGNPLINVFTLINIVLDKVEKIACVGLVLLTLSLILPECKLSYMTCSSQEGKKASTVCI